MKNGILVIAEHLKGALSDITYEMLGIGKLLADNLNTTLNVFIYGKDIKHLATNLSIADNIYVFDDPMLEMRSPDVNARIIGSLLKEKEISLVLIGGTNISSGIGPILSNILDIPFINFCKHIVIENDNMLVTSHLFGGKILTDIVLRDNQGIISIYPGSFPHESGKSTNPANIIDVNYPIPESRCKFINYIEPDTGDVDITKQDILVSVGRGIENQDNIGLAEELIEVLGGAICASRPVIDQGWLPISRQVGKSGMTVKPKLYLALGISGAPEHAEGMKDSELIISINKDSSAPIFNISHYGICADINDIIPPLIESLHKRK